MGLQLSYAILFSEVTLMYIFGLYSFGFGIFLFILGGIFLMIFRRTILSMFPYAAVLLYRQITANFRGTHTSGRSSRRKSGGRSDTRGS